MRHRLKPALVAVVLLAAANAAEAGPCTAEIGKEQERVDAQIEATAKAGRAGPESRGAKLHHQPTPRSIAEAEAQLGEGGEMDEAVSALESARAADTAGDEAGCERALKHVRDILAGKTE